MLPLLIQLPIPDFLKLPPQYNSLVWIGVIVSIVLVLFSQGMNRLAKAFKTCPNCQKVSPLGVETCPQCQHAFVANPEPIAKP